MVGEVTQASFKLGAPEVGGAAWKAKLTDGAKQFEAMLLEQMLKPLKFGGAPGSEDPSAADGDSSGQLDAGADVLSGMATQALAKAVADSGGFGLARQIVRQVSAEHDAVTGKPGSTKVHRVEAD